MNTTPTPEDEAAIRYLDDHLGTLTRTRWWFDRCPNEPARPPIRTRRDLEPPESEEARLRECCPLGAILLDLDPDAERYTGDGIPSADHAAEHLDLSLAVARRIVAAADGTRAPSFPDPVRAHLLSMFQLTEPARRAAR